MINLFALSSSQSKQTRLGIFVFKWNSIISVALPPHNVFRTGFTVLFLRQTALPISLASRHLHYLYLLPPFPFPRRTVRIEIPYLFPHATTLANSVTRCEKWIHLFSLQTHFAISNSLVLFLLHSDFSKYLLIVLSVV